jgi:hypothetical protein
MKKGLAVFHAKKMFAENKLHFANGLYFQTQLPIINLWKHDGGNEFKLMWPWTALRFNKDGLY